MTEERTRRPKKSDWDGKGAGRCRNTRIIAFGADGSTIIFDSLKEAAEFFDIRRTDQLKRLIDLGYPMPDGSTFCDYLVE